MGTAASLCVRPERAGWGCPSFPGVPAVRGCAQECGARLRAPPPAGMPPATGARNARGCCNVMVTGGFAPQRGTGGLSVGCVWDVIEDVREAGRGVFAEMEVRGRGQGCRAEGWEAAPPARRAGLVSALPTPGASGSRLRHSAQDRLADIRCFSGSRVKIHIVRGSFGVGFPAGVCGSRALCGVRAVQGIPRMVAGPRRLQFLPGSCFAPQPA